MTTRCSAITSAAHRQGKPSSWEALKRRVPFAALARQTGIPSADLIVIVRRLYDGEMLGRIAARFPLPHVRMAMVTKAIGWSRRWHVIPAPTNDVGVMPRKEVLALFQQGWTLEAIGRKAGVTRERIRQIARRHGLESRHATARRRNEERLRARVLELAQRARERVEKRKRRLAAQREAFIERYRDAQAKWSRGEPAQDIADALGISLQAFSWATHEAKRLHGLPWFMKRVKREMRISKECLALYRRICRSWNGGATQRDLSATHGLTARQIRDLIKSMRRKYGPDIAVSRAAAGRPTPAGAHARRRS